MKHDYLNNMQTPLRVHICVVGFEIDRISKAAILQKADKVYLITKKENDQGRWAVKANEKILKNDKVETQIIEIRSISELQCLLGEIKKIINKEKENIIYINISSGSSMAAIAGTISSMMFSNGIKIIPYYVKPKEYVKDLKPKERKKIKMRYNGEPRSIGIQDNGIEQILTFPLELPSKELIHVLMHINSYGGEIPKSKLIEFSKKEKLLIQLRKNQANIISKMQDIDIKSSQDKAKQEKPRDYAWINQNIVNKLKDQWHVIDVEKRGKISYIKINERGKKIITYLGADEK